jgi:hypothetical protein
MKNIWINYFTEIGVEKKGWLNIKGKTFGRDKQKHLVLGLLIFFLAFFVSSFIFGKTITDSRELVLTAIDNAFGATMAIAVAWEVKDFILFKLGSKINWSPLPDIVATTLLPFLMLISKSF